MHPFRSVPILLVSAFLLTGPALAQTGAVPDPSLPHCCELSEQPGRPDNPFCATGFDCCRGGVWQCNTETGDSSCAAPATACESRCCDPVAEPGAFGNPPCFEGASCCDTGEWQCNDGDGSSSCAVASAPCRRQCCDPRDEPGVGDNPICFEGATCCADGTWRCNNSDGGSSCAVDSVACPACCDPADEPGALGGAGCIEGATCCAGGQWQCNEGNGSSTCTIDGIVCEPRCCDVADEPGVGGNPPCVEGATCCADGTWRCNAADGTSTCAVESRRCQPQCCDPAQTPGAFGNPPCFEGATCCETGEWQCNDASGQSTCDADGARCETCCDTQTQPGQFGNPPCFEGATCCADGSWRCNDAGGNSTCPVAGLACEGCCDPADEPGVGGNPICFEGATCCSDGEWTCNNGAGQSTCPTDGFVCEPRCCDRDDRPNNLSTAQCTTGFTCCADGTYRCNDADGDPTCHLGEECPQVCGGIAGIPCDPGEFCRLPVGQCCCDRQGVCTEIPDACPDVVDPVCGCDGLTYGNACEAFAAGVSIEHRGECPQQCGGALTVVCPDGQFCERPPGECGAEGVCADEPSACPAHCDPVCGCDGQTYRNRCLAARAGVSIEHAGACHDGPALVSGVRFRSRQDMFWQPTQGALGYNVYLEELRVGPPDDFGRCLYTDLEQTRAPIVGAPPSQRMWWLQVTALFAAGEGPMGQNDTCSPRRPAEPCTCTQPADVGPCDGVFPRWYHDYRSDQCEEFVWGGCGGNTNNFTSEGRCEAVCETPCSLPPDPGECTAAFPRWFFNPASDRCERFVWGGCGGNANNYETRAECESACVCNLPPDPGPCEALIPRWFHNGLTGRCEEFVWGGCGGNDNNFLDQEACQARCEASR